MKKRTINTTADGTKTLFIESLGESYHSHNGALQEAKHVFIKNGINKLHKSEINILELGFGTGLNVLVTLDEFLKKEEIKKINYFAIEKYPLTPDEASLLEYDKILELEKTKNFAHKIHQTPWGQLTEITDNFFLNKIEADFYQLKDMDIPPIDIVYFDCFGAKIQPDLWEQPFIDIVTEKMNKDALLTTYSSKGSLKRALKNLNFDVIKLEGPKGKREMINAWKK